MMNSEQIYKNIIDSLPHAFIVLNKNLKVMHCNQRCVRLLSKTEKEILDRDLSELIPHTDLQNHARSVLQNGGTRLAEIHLKPLKPLETLESERPKILKSTVTALNTTDQGERFLLVTLEDINEQAQLEEQFIQSEKLAGMELLATSVAHELGSHLGVISSAIQYVRDASLLNPDSRSIIEAIETVMNSIEGIHEILGSLSDLERDLLAAEQKPCQELDVLYCLSRQLVATDDLRELLDSIVRHAVQIVHVTFCRLLTLEDGIFICRAAHSIRPLERGLGVGFPESDIAWPYYQRILQQNKSMILINPMRLRHEGGKEGLDHASWLNSDSYPVFDIEHRQALFLDLARSLCLIPLRVGDKDIGVMILGEVRSENREVFDANKLNLITAIGDQAASAIYRARLHEQLEENYIQTIFALAKAMDARDTYIADHSQRISLLAEAVAQELGCDEAGIEYTRWGALLHDIGKIGVPDQILRKPGPLTEEEWRIAKCHPEIGAEIVAPIKDLAPVAPIIRSHQEKYDGSGYPDGLRGEEIPLGARILAIVDAYVAITDDRVYRKARSHEEAISELRRCAGTHFDPQVVAAFLRVLERGIDM